MHSFGLLSAAIWAPIIGGFLVLAVGDRAGGNPARWLALLVSLLTFAITLPLFTGFDTHTAAMQFVERVPWIPVFHIT